MNEIKNPLQIDTDADMDRFYIPVNSHYEVQTKGKGSSFRIANTETHERFLITDERLHPMLEDLARTTNTELVKLRMENKELGYSTERANKGMFDAFDILVEKDLKILELENELAAMKSEPVAEVRLSITGRKELFLPSFNAIFANFGTGVGQGFEIGTKFYTAPQPREWVGLTTKDIDEIQVQSYLSYNYAFAIEAKLKQLNTKG